MQSIGSETRHEVNLGSGVTSAPISAVFFHSAMAEKEYARAGDTGGYFDLTDEPCNACHCLDADQYCNISSLLVFGLHSTGEPT